MIYAEDIPEKLIMRDGRVFDLARIERKIDEH